MKLTEATTYYDLNCQFYLHIKDCFNDHVGKMRDHVNNQFNFKFFWRIEDEISDPIRRQLIFIEDE